MRGTRPDVDEILQPLKPFQRRTVDHAFHRLFEAPDSTSRFLVADEVGLGKTLIARGLIAKAIDHYWDDVDRIDIVYICSNQSIAHSNLPKLQVTQDTQHSAALATRLTMLATELAPMEGRQGLNDSKVNFVSFTPGTSFEMGHSGGKAIERRVLFHLLEPLVGERKGLMNLLQGHVKDKDRFRGLLVNHPLPLEPGIAARFRDAFKTDQGLRDDLSEVVDTWFLKFREKYSKEANARRRMLIGELRRVLAKACIDALEPDLIILDEFQRFKNLLEHRPDRRDPAAELAQALFEAQTPEGHSVRTLLLSATPYKLYTTDAEIEDEDHYQDFLATSRFLMGDDEQRVRTLQSQLSHFGAALTRAAQGLDTDVLTAKTEVESTLRGIMARTERVAASDARDAMVEEPTISVQMQPADVRQYIAADKLFKAVGDSDPMMFWKSAPYLAHFMSGYKVNERLTETLGRSPEKVARVLAAHPEAFLDANSVKVWEEIDPGNAKLRELAHDLLDRGIWKLLWMPPTVPYWPLDGAYRGQENLTKTLVFSAWNVVPDVISGVLSYEAERRMVQGKMASYLDPDSQQRALLHLEQSGQGVRSRHRLLLLLLPCLTLADDAHPLTADHGGDRRAAVRRDVERLLARLPSPAEGPVDERWEYMLPVLLDPAMREFLLRWRSADDDSKPNPTVLPAYIDDLLELKPTDLGRRPDGLVDLAVDIALGSPAVIAARMLASANIDPTERRLLAAQLAHAFWKLFNRPAVTCLLSQLAGDDADAYWRQVLRYCIDGNLQAVLDETWHLTWEQHAWSVGEASEVIAARCITQIAESVEPRPSRIHARFYKANGSRKVKEETIRLRTVLALRFGHTRTDEGQLNQDAVRAAFNSPFRPFVLASTSIGQEGLDFHPWCHRLVHWNLPGNPVDLEQREGRVHRYKGHAVRRNVAADFANAAFQAWRPGADYWGRMFELADAEARSLGASDLIPFWIAPGPCKVQRRVPMLPYTQEVAAFGRLKRQLAAYRVVFGQPRQEELMTLLDSAAIDTASFSQWSIDLTPVGEKEPRQKAEKELPKPA